MDAIKTLKKFEYWDVILTVIAVFVLYQLLGVALGTSHPIDVVVSESMLPNMKPGDLIVCMEGQPEIDDVVIYSGIKKYPIIHRVIGTNDSYCRKDNPWKIKIENGTCYTIKGDNNNAKDPPVSEEQIMCVVKARIPYLGYPRYIIFKVFGI